MPVTIDEFEVVVDPAGDKPSDAPHPAQAPAVDLGEVAQQAEQAMRLRAERLARVFAD